MAKVNNMQRKSESRRRKVTPHPFKDVHKKSKSLRRLEKKEWKESTCSVCMEYPHNAVLLLCSSYNKGCRPYMCATSNRYSNCLEQYKKAYTKVTSLENPIPGHGSTEDSDVSLGLGCLNEKTELEELLCPLCRGQVKGWTVVKPARKYFNTRRRTCMQDKCSFVGTYKELRKHVRAEHPRARTREVDPLLAEKWKKLEHDREREDVISTIRSSVPGAIVIGDYVIERNYRGFPGDFDGDDFLSDAVVRLGSFGDGRINHDEFDSDYDSWDEEEDIDDLLQGALASSSSHVGDNLFSRFTRYSSSRLLPGRVRRRRRRRVAG